MKKYLHVYALIIFSDGVGRFDLVSASRVWFEAGNGYFCSFACTGSSFAPPDSSLVANSFFFHSLICIFHRRTVWERLHGMNDSPSTNVIAIEEYSRVRQWNFLYIVIPTFTGTAV